MPQLIADQRDIEFNLYELFNVDTLCSHEKFKRFDKTSFNLILAEARKFALNEMLSVYQDGDEQGVHYNDGRIFVPQSFHRVHRHYCENQWNAPASDQAFGGQGLPRLIAAAVGEYMMGSNWPVYAYGSMGSFTGNIIGQYGSFDQKQTYVRKLYTGQWGGSILHTESWAGTDLGAMAASAVKNNDGTFNITGNNIYITNGDHDLSKNIIHMVPARVQEKPGQDSGTGPGSESGLSLFIVPKFSRQPDGRPGKPNDIFCTGLEKKHGLHGSATCSMAFGSRNRCIGYLLGRHDQGMEIMITMLNQARLNMGLQALAYGSSAYLYALNYARNRIQGGVLESLIYRETVPVPIIRHPDVKQNLLHMKAVVQGVRSLIYFAMDCIDRAGIENSKKQRQQLENLVELIIPVIKGYGCEQGYKVCIKAIQVFGGTGYISGYMVESIARDCKITTLFEGCTEIQAMDLVSQKLMKDQGKALNILIEQMNTLIEKTRSQDQVKAMGRKFSILVNQFSETWARLESQLAEDNFACAPSFMTIMGEVCLGWMLLWRASSAEKALLGKNIENSDQDFYNSQIITARYFFQSLMPVTQGRMEALEKFEFLISKIRESDFGAI